jgi:hypothetical protein
MRSMLAVLVILGLHATSSRAQVIVQPPQGITAYISCDAYPIWPHTLQIRYRMNNIRPGGEWGTFKLWYAGEHANESPLDNASTANFLAADVDVQEEFSDMGQWIMADNIGRNRWEGECVRAGPNDIKYVYGIDIYGNLQEIPEPDCPPEWDDHGEYCVESEPDEPENPGGGGGDGDGDGNGCTWWLHTKWVWNSAISDFEAVDHWWTCEYN